MRCSIHFSLLAAGVGGWVVSCYNLCEDYWPNIEFAIQLSQYRGGADTNTGDDTAFLWSGSSKPCENYKYKREIQMNERIPI